MAAVEEKLTDQPIITSPTGGVMHIVVGGTSYRISTANLLAALTTAISDLQAYDNQAVQTEKQKNQSANYSFALGADVALESIDFIHVSGSVTIKVGTYLGASDVLPEQTFTSDSLRNAVPMYFAGSTTLYFTISSGTTDTIINYRQSYNS